MSSSQYPQPPPTYQPAAAPYKDVPETSDPASPLLGSARAAGPSRAGGIYDMPEPGDIPDDFKYGTTVSDCAPEIRQAFVRKVYTILFCQILATTIVGGFLSQSESTVNWVLSNPWAFYLPLFGTMINLGVLYWKRHSHPANLFLLSSFTLLEAFTIGIAISFYSQIVILKALIITLGIFVGLTLFTLQSKYDFSGLGPWLFGSLVALMMTGFVGMIFPFGHTFEMIYSAGGAVIFSGYIVYDTYEINKRMSPDEWIASSIALYLDFINLFLNILRLLNNSDN